MFVENPASGQKFPVTDASEIKHGLNHHFVDDIAYKPSSKIEEKVDMSKLEGKVAALLMSIRIAIGKIDALIARGGDTSALSALALSYGALETNALDVMSKINSGDPTAMVFLENLANQYGSLDTQLKKYSSDTSIAISEQKSETVITPAIIQAMEEHPLMMPIIARINQNKELQKLNDEIVENITQVNLDKNDLKTAADTVAFAAAQGQDLGSVASEMEADAMQKVNEKYGDNPEKLATMRVKVKARIDKVYAAANDMWSGYRESAYDRFFGEESAYQKFVNNFPIYREKAQAYWGDKYQDMEEYFAETKTSISGIHEAIINSDNFSSLSEKLSNIKDFLTDKFNKEKENLAQELLNDEAKYNVLKDLFLSKEPHNFKETAKLLGVDEKALIDEVAKFRKEQGISTESPLSALAGLAKSFAEFIKGKNEVTH